MKWRMVDGLMGSGTPCRQSLGCTWVPVRRACRVSLKDMEGKYRLTPDWTCVQGILSLKDMEEKFVFHGVHMMFDGKPGAKWKEGEERVSKMVFIGRELDGDLLKEGFEHW